jgi:CheY-like chemotaxis protein
MNVYKGKGTANNPIQPKSKAIGRILIADDDADTVLTYKSALEKAGYRVIAVDNGEDCAKAYMEEFQKLRISRAEDPIKRSTHWNQPFEAVILDYRMPQMNGMEVAKEILAVNPHQRIIFASAYIQETVKDSEGAQTGCRAIAKALLLSRTSRYYLRQTDLQSAKKI